MKHLLRAAAAVMLIITTPMLGTIAHAQTKVYPVQCPSVTAGGGLNDSTTVNTVYPWPSSALPLYQGWDSVGSTATVKDSVVEQLVGEYNSVTMAVRLIKLAGTSCDSAQVTFWTSPNSGASYVLEQTALYNIGTTTDQTITWRPSWVGNRATHYKVSAIIRDYSGAGCYMKWKPYLLVR
ncbi:MAG: hypothetical protein EBZ77_08195 [Chitinophagia bacterium]|nr:hypothetical protein [Chitinophagia bacterium]